MAVHEANSHRTTNNPTTKRGPGFMTAAVTIPSNPNSTPIRTAWSPGQPLRAEHTMAAPKHPDPRRPIMGFTMVSCRLIPVVRTSWVLMPSWRGYQGPGGSAPYLGFDPASICLMSRRAIHSGKAAAGANATSIQNQQLGSPRKGTQIPANTGISAHMISPHCTTQTLRTGSRIAPAKRIARTMWANASQSCAYNMKG